jgi:hypothetical protein
MWFSFMKSSMYYYKKHTQKYRKASDFYHFHLLGYVQVFSLLQIQTTELQT